MVDGVLINALIFLFSDARSAIDIGCGNGGYTKALIGNGIPCVGYDGSPLTPEITGGICRVADFSEPKDFGRFELVLSLEVGEHIPEQYEQVFIDNLCRMSVKYVCMSWAIVGQNGTGHVNCKNNDYIIEQMALRGFRYDKESSEFLRLNNSHDTFPWFDNTLMVFEK
jgi:tryptophanyl-tRNA synthetase